MQSDNTAKQKTVPGRLSVALLYVTVNRLLIPALPAQTAQESFTFTKIFCNFDAKRDVERGDDLLDLEFLLFLAS